MAVKNPKCLVIDTSVMRAAGGENAIYPESKYCRDFLNEILKLGHSIIVTDELLEEWEKHRVTTKSFDGKPPSWYTKMRLRGQVRRQVGDIQQHDLREAVFRVVDAQAVENVRKDMRLVEAAMLADKTVSSHDERMRGHFRRAAPHVEELRVIVWVNPTFESEACIEWLRQSCPADKHRQLGYIPEDEK